MAIRNFFLFRRLEKLLNTTPDSGWANKGNGLKGVLFNTILRMTASLLAT